MKGKVIIGILGACILSMVISSCTTHAEQSSKDQQSLKVRVLRIDSASTGIIRNYVGTIEENSSTALSFSTGGYVQQVNASEGQFVKKGDLLVSLDKSNAQSTYDVAKATLEQAQDGYRRLKQVYDQGGIAEVKWIEMETNLAKAQSMESIARKNLNDCDMYAPFDGFIGTNYAQAGMNLLPMQPTIILLDIGVVYAKFTVPENEISFVKIGQEGEVSVSAANNQTYKGKIAERGVVADALSHSYTVKIKLQNPQKTLLPGMVCKVGLHIDSDISGVVIPNHAVQTDIDGTYVWLAQNGKAVRRRVAIGDFAPAGVYVTEGLAVNDQVITEGYLKLSEGSNITVTE